MVIMMFFLLSQLVRRSGSSGLIKLKRIFITLRTSGTRTFIFWTRRRSRQTPSPRPTRTPLPHWTTPDPRCPWKLLQDYQCPQISHKVWTLRVPEFPQMFPNLMQGTQQTIFYCNHVDLYQKVYYIAYIDLLNKLPQCNSFVFKSDSQLFIQTVKVYN